MICCPRCQVDHVSFCQALGENIRALEKRLSIQRCAQYRIFQLQSPTTLQTWFLRYTHCGLVALLLSYRASGSDTDSVRTNLLRTRQQARHSSWRCQAG